LSNTQNSPEVSSSITDRNNKRRILRSNCSSPAWAEGCQPEEEIEIANKKVRGNNHDALVADVKQDGGDQRNSLKRGYNDIGDDLNSKGDGALDRRVKRRLVPITPPNQELGQGDCIPSTSGTDSDKSHNTLNAQLPKLYVECNGYIQFMRSRNSNSIDAMKWERKCKAQISYSLDPLNVGEYIIWAIHYTDESKCRRNLLSAFEEVSLAELQKN
jgi:hypothetical protein